MYISMAGLAHRKPLIADRNRKLLSRNSDADIGRFLQCQILRLGIWPST
jgi:hypothetical protein